MWNHPQPYLSLTNMFATILFMIMRRSEPVSRRTRPAKPALTRAGIVGVAVRILREEGLERATMRRIAIDLDTGPASLYVYVHNTAELHIAVLDQLLRDLDLRADTVEGRWQDRLVKLLVDYAQLLVAHPSLARSVLALRPSEPNYLRLADSILALLHAGGVPAEQAAWGVDLLLLAATAIGAEQGTRDESVEAYEEADAAAVILGELAVEDYPNLTAVAREIFSGTAEQRIRWTFSALIRGIGATATPAAD
jgi:AcrR family transcriptional regulator